ncbi:MAG TPA: hypothetical protein VGD98_00910 [Ktedonobacteraceae bacterium]
MQDEAGESKSLQPMPQEPMSVQVDLLAASLRADTSDLKAFLEVLAVKLEGALPNQTAVVRQSKLFSREHPVREILVTLDEYQYRISRESQGSLLTMRAKVVRGIVLKTDQLPMERWIEELAEGLARQAGQSEQARHALERFLL